MGAYADHIANSLVSQARMMAVTAERARRRIKSSRVLCAQQSVTLESRQPHRTEGEAHYALPAKLRATRGKL